MVEGTAILFYEPTLRFYQEEIDTKDALNNKINTLLATTTAIITLYIGLTINMYSFLSSDVLYIFSIVHVTGVILLLLSMLCGVMAYEVLKISKNDVLQISPKRFIEQAGNKTEEKLTEELTKSLSKSWKTHYDGNVKKDHWLGYAFYLLIMGVCSMLLLLIMFISIIE